MSREKNSKIEVKSNKEESSSASDDSEATNRQLSFDIYFQKLTNERKVLPHHKAPMKKFAEQYGALTASEEEFEELFRSY